MGRFGKSASEIIGVRHIGQYLACRTDSPIPILSHASMQGTQNKWPHARVLLRCVLSVLVRVL